SDTWESATRPPERGSTSCWLAWAWQPNARPQAPGSNSWNAWPAAKSTSTKPWKASPANPNSLCRVEEKGFLAGVDVGGQVFGAGVGLGFGPVGGLRRLAVQAFAHGPGLLCG